MDDEAPAVMRVHALSTAARRGRLVVGPFNVPCALGRSGTRWVKREGDGASPAGAHRLLSVLYRSDRVVRPVTRLPVLPIRPGDGWCDDPGHGRYNRPVRLPFAASHERLWREDHLYDIVVVLDQNQCPRVRGRGSAVFLHLAKPGYRPTEGCVAVAARDMRLLLARAGCDTVLRIG